jgi:hypothetical protein
MKNFFSLSLIIVSAALIFPGCENKGDPPALPPAESMTIDFSYFTTAKKSAAITYDSRNIYTDENTNWIVAATVAGVWNTILVANLTVPKAAFEKAIDSKPSYLDNKTWEWKYSVTVLGTIYRARLTGQIRTDSIKWEMYIAMEGIKEHDEFKWFEGTTTLGGNGGQWILSQSQAVQVPILKIDWEKTGTDVTGIKYTYINTADVFYGSYIEYGKLNGSLDAFFNVSFWETNREKFVDVNIKWSTTVFNGQVQAPDYFQDNNWHCWDGDGNDVTCPTR